MFNDQLDFNGSDSLEAASQTKNTICYHCGELVPKSLDLFASIDKCLQPMCCVGCKAVAEIICTTGMKKFYQQRANNSDASLGRAYDNASFKRMTSKIKNGKNASHYWAQYDSKEIREKYITTTDEVYDEVILYVDNIYCSACSWLIDKTLNKVSGIIDVKINIVEKTVFVQWLKKEIKISDILIKLAQFGYSPKPILFVSDIDTKQQRHSALKRLAVSAFGMMQVMSYSASLYLGEFQGITPDLQRFFIILSMLIATVVVFYSGKPFFNNATRDVRQGHFGMDVPIALAIGVAYSASVYSVFFANDTTVYFDSAIMFVFFLSVSRYIEMIIRHRAVNQRGALNALIPSVADILRDGKTYILPVSDILYKDHVVVAKHEVFPVDGYLAKGIDNALVDESIVTGESTIKNKTPDDIILAGSRNMGSVVNLIATRLGKDTALANIEKLLYLSKTNKPNSISVTEMYARYFVFLILVLALISGLAWAFIDSSRVFQIVLSILIVSCPCALALAAPAAESIAVQTLLSKGVLVVNSTCLSIFNDCCHWVFDKTGTLTSGEMVLYEIDTGNNISKSFALDIAVCLEESSVHSIASAFKRTLTNLSSDSINHITGEGVEGRIDGVDYRIGNYIWVNGWSNSKFFCPNTISTGQTRIFLASKNRFIASFTLNDSLRSGARSSVSFLKDKGMKCHVLSGDAAVSVADMANILSIENYLGQCNPEGKIKYVQDIRKKSSSPIVMVGDGVNDAPVLSNVDIAISMGAGSDLAQSASDVVFLNNKLDGILDVLAISKKYKRIANQNYIWAISYNLILLPLAMLGFLTPWLAALGMSASSLIVVLNAARISFGNKIKA